MPWQPLTAFRDPAVPKLNNLRRAAEAGLRVPPTWWLRADEVLATGRREPPDAIRFPYPVIIRSGSPTEDGRTTSNAGQLLSLPVERPGDFADVLARVAAVLPRDGFGHARGVVFMQPLVRAAQGGVAFFDGFYFERTTAAGGNVALTAGTARGRVERGHLRRGDRWSKWLTRVYRVFGQRDPVIDVEFAEDAKGFVLLQCRPALFPVRRNPTITLANHRETLGELPSPWSVSTMVEGGKDTLYLASVEPEIGRWDLAYAVECAGRTWLNLSSFFRWLDHLGLPRTFATASIGGDLGSRADAEVRVGRFLRALPRLLRQVPLAVRKVMDAPWGLEDADRAIEAATGLDGLYRVTVSVWVFGINTALSIAGVYALISRLRLALRVPSSAKLVTTAMMDEYGRLAVLPDPAARAAGLDAWLARYGHRGPRESDFAQPRFSDLREILLRDLSAAPVRVAPPVAPQSRLRRAILRLFRPLYAIDEWREWFRDAIMRRWQRIRLRMLEEGARLVAADQLERPDDVFWVHGDDLRTRRPLREAVAERKRLAETYRSLNLPLTATLDEIERLVARAETAPRASDDRRVFPGIAVTHAVFDGVVRKADDLAALLTGGAAFDAGTVLVVPALEPSWAVVFPRVGGVVAEVGGELSHASILLREARKPAVVNCAGIYAAVKDGERLRLNGKKGRVERLDQ